MLQLRRLANGLLYTDKGQILTAVIIGLGLSLMFQRVCKDKKSCVLIYAPPLAEVREAVYKIDGECFKYAAKDAACMPEAIGPAP